MWLPPPPPPPYQLFEQRGQYVIQRLVANGGVKLLKGFSRSLPDLLQGVAQSLSHCGDQGLGEDQNLQRSSESGDQRHYLSRWEKLQIPY